VQRVDLPDLLPAALLDNTPEQVSAP
jgi:hypothetical protein